MGKYNMCMKKFLQNKEHFADLFNGCCFQGKQIILPEDLREAAENYVVSDALSTVSPESMTESDAMSEANNCSIGKQQRKKQKLRARSGIELSRDVKMILGSGMLLQVLAVENQSYIDYAMPVRCMGYDAAEYSRQLKELKQNHQLLRKHKRHSITDGVEDSDKDIFLNELPVAATIGEKLSVILKTDRLHTVYTLCLYSGIEPWDGPRKLSDMMEFDPKNKILCSLFEEYHLHLFCINEQNGFDTFHSDLKPLFQAMNCRNDKEKMAELMKDEIYAHLNEDTWDAIAVMTDNAAMLQKKNLYKTENQEKEEFNMCQALEALMEDERIAGRNEGRNEATLEKTKIVVRNMIARGYKTEDICTIADCDSSIVENIRESMS